MIPSKPGERIKTDRRDACKLAQCLRAGDLTPVYVPDEQTEALRDLERVRAAAKKAETTARHQLSKFLPPSGTQVGGGSNWTLKHRAWIRQQAFKQEAHRRVLGRCDQDAGRCDRTGRATDGGHRGTGVDDAGTSWSPPCNRCGRGHDQAW
ncbi:MAG: transposase [Planctomycetaceae bacterium]